MGSVFHNKIYIYSISCFFIILIPFYDIPKTFIEGLSYSFFVGSFLIFFYLFYRSSKIPLQSLFLFSVFLFFYTFSLIINIDNVDERGLNHVLLYLVSFLIYYVLFYFILNKFGEKFIAKYVFYGLIALSIIGTLEVSAFFILGFDSYADFLDHGRNIGIFMGIMPRMRSLFNEPSHLAIYTIAVAPIVWNYNRYAKYLIAYLLFFTFSTSAAFSLAISCFLYFLYKFLKAGRSRYFIYFILSLVVLSVTFSWLANTAIFSKLYGLFSSDSTDAVRKYAVLKSIEYFGENPILGLGPTFYYTYTKNGLFNLFLQIYIESGVLGLSSFLLFFFSHLKGAIKNSVYFIAFFAIFFIFFGMNHYYIPGFWMLLAFMNYKGQQTE